jgi:hypothetical protein
MQPSAKRKRAEKSLDRRRIEIAGLVIGIAARDPLSSPALMFAPLAAVGLCKVGIGVRPGTI